MSADTEHSVEAGGNIYFLESEADLFNLSYVRPLPLQPSAPATDMGDSYSYSHSPSSSYTSTLSPSSSSYSEYSDMSGEAHGQSYTININITDIENQVC